MITRTIRWILLVLLAAAVAASLLPLVETNTWWIRYLDFVRLQLAGLIVVLMVLYLLFGAWRRPFGLLVVVLVLVALGYHAYRLYPYAPIAGEMAVSVDSCPDGSRVRVMIANVRKTNRHDQELFKIVEDVDPDLFLVMETNEWWDEALQRLDERFPYKIQQIPTEADFFGIHLLSKDPLVDPGIRFYFGADTPTVVSGVTLPGGDIVQFIGLHPRPPLYWSQPSTMRDALILASALESAESTMPTIIGGDFNAVPWERTTRRGLRIGELLDPRVGRGILPTYDARSWWESWPLDQIVFQDRIGLETFEVLPAFGSDHYPVVADLCLAPDLAGRQSAPALEDGDLEEAQTSIEAAKEMNGQP